MVPRPAANLPPNTERGPCGEDRTARAGADPSRPGFVEIRDIVTFRLMPSPIAHLLGHFTLSSRWVLVLARGMWATEPDPPIRQVAQAVGGRARSRRYEGPLLYPPPQPAWMLPYQQRGRCATLQALPLARPHGSCRRRRHECYLQWSVAGSRVVPGVGATIALALVWRLTAEAPSSPLHRSFGRL